MVNFKQIAKSANAIKSSKTINWFPGHMYAGMQAMVGKLNTVDCVVEVHDARIPFTGRNSELKKQLGSIKPHVLVLNKSDLADLSRWKTLERRLKEQGDQNVILTDLTGTQFSVTERGYTNLMSTVVNSINKSDRYNRQNMNFFKIMIVGIPNVGKSTLINRLRQHHLGLGGQPAKTGAYAGVTRAVENMIKICPRPLIYSIDTPGILQPGSLRNKDDAMRLALCSTINDAVLNIDQLARYLLDHLNKSDNDLYQTHLGLDKPAASLEELVKEVSLQWDEEARQKLGDTSETPVQRNKQNEFHKICWLFIRGFRKGCYGKVMFD